jgi:hypothetical protein
MREKCQEDTLGQLQVGRLGKPGNVYASFYVNVVACSNELYKA